MQASLDQMIQFTARQTKRDEDVVKSGNVYSEDALAIVNKYIDGFNYAKNKIIRERYRPSFTETATIGANNTIDLNTLSKTVLKIIDVYFVTPYCAVNDWEQGNDFTLRFPVGTAGNRVSIEYAYMLPDFPNNPTATDLQMTLDLPEAIVDYRILCYYAAYEYHAIKGSDRDLDKASIFLPKWNDGFLRIPKSVKGISRVKDRAGY